MPLQMYQEQKTKPLSQVNYILGIAAGKGGVGKSTVSVNCARAFQQMGLKVGVMDTDIYGPSLRRLLPETQMPAKKGDKIIPADCSGIKMISMAHFRNENEASVVRAPIANGVIKQFIQQVDWGELDILMLDFPPGTGDVQLTLAQEAKLSGAVMVTTPQELAVMDVRKAVNMFHQVQVPVLGVVENMSYYREGADRKYLFGRGGGDRLACEIGAPFLGEIPLHPDICRLGDSGRSIFEGSEQEIQQPFLQIAEKIYRDLQMGQQNDYQFRQVDPHSFELTRPDGKVFRHRLSDLQRRCPCAGCDQAVVDDNVKATRVEFVGHYGLRIQFTSGCSNGIYSFESLIK